MGRLEINAADDNARAFAYIMAECRRSAHAIEDQNNGGRVSARKPCDPLSSYLYRSVVLVQTPSCLLIMVQGNEGMVQGKETEENRESVGRKTSPI